MLPLYAVRIRIIDAIEKNTHNPLALYAVVNNMLYDKEKGVLKYNYHRRSKKGWGYLVSAHNTNDLFDGDIWLRESCDKNNHSKGFGIWLLEMEKYSAFSNTANLVLKQLYDLSNRLDILYKKKVQIAEMFNDSEAARPLDKDIEYLSELGWRLVLATRSFFKSAKKTMIKLEIASARQEALNGLKTFNQNIENVRSMQMKAVDESIELVVKALKDLEEAANK
jgi:hypothetical protein